MFKRSLRRFSHHKPFYSLALLLLIAAGITYAIYRNHGSNAKHPTVNTTPGQKIDYSPAPAADNNANNARKGNSPTSGQTLTQSSNANFTATITRASVNSGALQVASLINGTSTGSCTLSVSQSGQTTITRSNTVEQEVNSYVCPVFNIPISDFPNNGKWNVSLSVTSGGKTATNEWTGNPVSL